MPRFLVLSYDNDAQQTHYDWVCAPNEDAATEQIDTLRPYALTSCAIPPEELRAMAEKLEKATEAEIQEALYLVAEESQLLDPDDPALAIEADESIESWHLIGNDRLWFGKVGGKENA
jgi:hypothetical protein